MKLAVAVLSAFYLSFPPQAIAGWTGTTQVNVRGGKGGNYAGGKGSSHKGGQYVPPKGRRYDR